MTIAVTSRSAAEKMVRSKSEAASIGAIVSIFTPPESRFAAWGKCSPLTRSGRRVPRIDVSFDDSKHVAVDIYPPTAADVDRLLAWADEPVGAVALSTDRTLLVHCDAGVSRSSACAIAILVKHGIGCEEALHVVDRACAAGMWPNGEVIALADAALDQGGRLIAAVDDFKAALRGRLVY